MEKQDYIKEIPQAERRFFTAPVSVQKRAEGDDNIVEGVAAIVEKETDLGFFREKIARGAFDDVLNDDVRALFNHDPNFILGRTASNTLEIGLNENGDLTYKYTTPDRQYARDLYDAIKSGDVDQSSFAFIIKEHRWEFDEENPDNDLRTIEKIGSLIDVSPVTYPAYQDTKVAARSRDARKNDVKKPNLKTKSRKRKLQIL
jgi:hypothetical protein